MTNYDAVKLCLIAGMADPAQLDAFVSELLAEGLLDEQFSQLMQLQDDTNPHFVAEVRRIRHDSCRAGTGICTTSVAPEIGQSGDQWTEALPRAASCLQPWELCTRLSSGS